MNMAHNATAHFGINRYSDLTPEEFQALRLNRNLSLIVGARLKSIQEKQPSNNTSSLINTSNVKYVFTDNNAYDRYPSFYKPTLLHKNINFIPLKVDW